MPSCWLAVDIHVGRLRTVGLCLRPSQRLMQCRCRHGCRKQERAQAGSGDDAAVRGGRARKAVVQCAVSMSMSYSRTPKSSKIVERRRQHGAKSHPLKPSGVCSK
jgi:hypothetical protein